MGKKGDYIRRGDLVFEDFFRNMTQYIEVKTSGNNPEWNHIVKPRLDELLAAYREWHAAFLISRQPHTPAQTTSKNEIKDASIKLIRPFVQQFLMFPPVTDADRINMRLPIRDRTHSVLQRPDKPPVFIIRPKDNRVISIDFRAEKGGSRARPYGYSGAVICYALLDHPPKDYKELTEHKLATRTPFTIEFDENDRGKHLYAALFWQNTKGDEGPWSDIQMTVVP